MTGELDVYGERLVLRPDRSLYWPRANGLVIADPHFGKADTFRAFGLPVPGGTEEPLSRLAAALADTGADRLVVLGDFWHARAGRTPRLVAELSRWKERAARLAGPARPGESRPGRSAAGRVG